MTKRPSLRAAIDAKCKSCIYDPGSRGLGAWREQVAACSSTNCPLHPVRPLPAYEKKAEKPASLPVIGQEEPETADDAADDIGALLGGVFGP